MNIFLSHLEKENIYIPPQNLKISPLVGGVKSTQVYIYYLLGGFFWISASLS